MGVQAVSDAAILVDGGWYHPAMPEELVNALSPHSSEDTEMTVSEALSARRPFEVAAPANPDSAARRLAQHYTYRSGD